VVGVVCLLPAVASANGIVSHMHISDLAVERLPDGELKELLRAHVEVYRAGSVFPDSGYAADDDYGEIAHWEPFTETYVSWVRERFEGDYGSEEAQTQIAFLLGQASHGMSDQVFDSLFMHRTRQFDGDPENLDVGAETWLIVEHDPDNQIEGFLPELMVDVWESSEHIDYVPSRGALEDGRDTVVQGINLLYAFGDIWYEMYWRELPWSATHYYEAENVPGSLPHIATFVAAYWQAIWDRLRGEDVLDELMLGTWPADGALNFEVDPERAETRTMMVFGHGVARDDLDDEHCEITGPEGVVASNARFVYGSEFANAVLVEPEETLAYDTEYTVTVQGLTAIDGQVLSEAHSFSFRTRCAPDALDDCPPLPEEWDPPEGPPERDAGPRPTPPDAGTPDGGVAARDAGATVEPTSDDGCGCRTSSGAPSAGLAMLLLLAMRRRR